MRDAHAREEIEPGGAAAPCDALGQAGPGPGQGSGRRGGERPQRLDHVGMRLIGLIDHPGASNHRPRPGLSCCGAICTPPDRLACGLRPSSPAREAAPEGKVPDGQGDTDDQQQELRLLVAAGLADAEIFRAALRGAGPAPDDPSARAEILLLSSSILVPSLSHDGIEVWDTLAIGEYLNGGGAGDRAAAGEPCGAGALPGDLRRDAFRLRRAPLGAADESQGSFPGFKVWSRARPISTASPRSGATASRAMAARS